MSLLLAVALLLSQAEPIPRIPPEVHDARFANVVLRVYGDDELKRAHMGYWSALETRPEWREQEAVWWNVAGTQDLGPLLIRADELLQRIPEAQARYDQYYETLAGDPSLQETVEQFERGALKARGRPQDWLGALHYFRTNPEAALSYLGGVTADSELPERLKPYAVPLMNVRSWNGLRDPLAKILGAPAGKAELVAWWKEAELLDAAHDGVFSQLAAHFLQHPNRFWALHRRELALAANPQLRDWTRWWHRRIRREPEPYRDYLRYLGAMRMGQETAPPASGKPWPPDEIPPALGVIAEDRLPALPSSGGKQVLRPSALLPEPPEIHRPERPVRPEMRQSDRMREREAAQP